METDEIVPPLIRAIISRCKTNDKKKLDTKDNNKTSCNINIGKITKNENKIKNT
jgi:hypothetical protein